MLEKHLNDLFEMDTIYDEDPDDVGYDLFYYSRLPTANMVLWKENLDVITSFIRNNEQDVTEEYIMDLQEHESRWGTKVFKFHPFSVRDHLLESPTDCYIVMLALNNAWGGDRFPATPFEFRLYE